MWSLGVFKVVSCLVMFLCQLLYLLVFSCVSSLRTATSCDMVLSCAISCLRIISVPIFRFLSQVASEKFFHNQADITNCSGLGLCTNFFFVCFSQRCLRLTCTVGVACQFGFFGGVWVGVVGALHFVWAPCQFAVVRIASPIRCWLVFC